MRWTKEEIDYLKEVYPTTIPFKKILQRLNRTRKAISHKGARLGLSRPHPPVNKPKNKNHRNIVDKRYYENHKGEIYRRRRKRLKNRKVELINILGGKCKICGYNKCPAALEFHHTGEGKEAHVAHLIENFSKQKALKEIKKCILLCANCHRELHFAG